MGQRFIGKSFDLEALDRFLLTAKSIEDYFFLKINIPIFHHSLAQTWHAKHEYKELIYEIL